MEPPLSEAARTVGMSPERAELYDRADELAERMIIACDSDYRDVLAELMADILDVLRAGERIRPRARWQVSADAAS